MSVRVFEETWVPLPGTRDVWPTDVRDGEVDMVVIEREGRPVVNLDAGDHELSGQFLWSEMPQKMSIPSEIGILSLRVGEDDVPIPNWDTNGEVWLRRIQSEPADEDRLNRFKSIV